MEVLSTYFRYDEAGKGQKQMDELFSDNVMIMLNGAQKLVHKDIKHSQWGKREDGNVETNRAVCGKLTNGHYIQVVGINIVCCARRKWKNHLLRKRSTTSSIISALLKSRLLEPAFAYESVPMCIPVCAFT
ncbi:hypothetical protein [Bacillus sp. NPDC093026]|uniref:hypothetical protein n=1 Tax=Bacillus sp. NPDC093026 TaxID=3363948 RepID=UPI0037F84ED8